MTLLHTIKELALKAGVEVNWYTPKESDKARLFKLLDFHKIDTILDVGANDGRYGKLLRKGGYGGAILSFEPLSAAYAKLLRAAADDTAWHVAPRMAVGSTHGEIEINIAGNSTSSSLLPMKDLHKSAAPHSKYIGTEMVSICRLDEFAHPVLNHSNAILLKIDTQGYEMLVLEGAEKLLQKVVGIQIELSLIPLYDGQKLYLDVIEWLSQRGFDLWSVMPVFVDGNSGRLLQIDGIFFCCAAHL